MPVSPTYPGVYIEEIPSGVRTITGVATSLTAFIGRTLRGPVNEPLIVNNFGEFENLFGGLDPGYTVAYAVQDFFNNGGSQALIVRLYKPFFTDEAARNAAFTSAKDQAQTAADEIRMVAATAAGSNGATAASVATAANDQVGVAGAPGKAALLAAQQVAISAQAESTKPAYMATIQRMDISGDPDAGTIKVKFNGAETADIALTDLIDATAATGENALKSALENLPNIGAGNIAGVLRSGTSPNFSYLIVFGGILVGTQNLITLSNNALTGGTNPTVDFSPPLPNQRMDISGDPSDGTIKLKFNGAETADIALTDLINATASTGEDALKSALEGLASVGMGNIVGVLRSGTTPNFSFLIVFDEDVVGTNDLITLSDNSLGGTNPTVTFSLSLPNADSVAGAAANSVDEAVIVAAGAIAPINRARLTFDNNLVLEAATPGEWGNFLQIKVDYDTKPKDDGSIDGTLYNLTVTDTSTDRSESIRNTTGIPGAAREISRVLKDESSLIRVVDAPDETRPSEGDYMVDADGMASDSDSLGSSDFIGDETKKTGLYALEKADLFNLLCIPPDTRTGDTDKTVYQKAMKLCVDHRAMLIVDSPFAWSANPDIAAATAVSGLSSLGLNGPYARNVALFFPRFRKSDLMRAGQIDTFVPCGAIAGVFARTDSTRGVWKAPAGLDAAINGIVSLEVNLSDGENGRLNPLAINTLRSFPNAGQVVWGARTLRGADRIGDEYKYIPVRRLALFIEETLYRNTQWVVFEPNDEPLWAQIRLNIGAFMHDLFVQGAFQGKTPREAYFVKCDKETTTQNDINKGIVNIVVGFAPLKPAEFVIIKLQQIAGQIQV